MQLNLLSSMLIFLGSYTPLSLILLIQDIDASMASKPFCLNVFRAGCSLPLNTPKVSIPVVIACAISLLLTLMVISNTSPKKKAELKSIKQVPGELINYSLPYIVTLMSINYTDTKEIFGFLVFILWIFAINHRSGTIILNPVLSVFGWKLYEVTYKRQGETRINQGKILYRGRLAENALIKYEHIQDIIVDEDDE